MQLLLRGLGLIALAAVLWSVAPLVNEWHPTVEAQSGFRLFLNHPTTGRPSAVTVDPCSGLSIAAKTAYAMQLTADTEILAANASVIYVCGFSGTFTGTTPSLRLQGGTGSTCGTGTTQLTGIWLPTAGVNVEAGLAGIHIAKTTAGQALCADVGGTPVIGGVLVYAIP